MRFNLSVAFILLATSFTYSQGIDSDYYTNLRPESPGDYTFGNYSNTEVDLYSGVPTINIPICDLKSRDLTLPVSLNYDARGVKVGDVASWVGLKWNLSAGGYIERKLNGLPDELPSIGFFDISASTNEFDPTTLGNKANWVNWHEKKEKDTQPDEFYLNANGLSVKFLIRPNGNVITTPRSDIKIEPEIVGDEIVSFRASLPDGRIYDFGKENNSVDQTKIETSIFNLRYDQESDNKYTFYDKVVLPSFYEGDPNLRTVYLGGSIPIIHNEETKEVDYYNSKWHLTKISNLKGDYISFKYNNIGEVSNAIAPQQLWASQVMGVKEHQTWIYEYYYDAQYNTTAHDCIGYQDPGPSNVFLVGNKDAVNNQLFNLPTPHNGYLPDCEEESAFPDVWTNGQRYVHGVLKDIVVRAVRKFGATDPGSGFYNNQRDITLSQLKSKGVMAKSSHYGPSDDGFNFDSAIPNAGGGLVSQSKFYENKNKLTEIETSTGNRIIFSSTQNSPELPGATKLNSIEVRNLQNQIIKKYVLNYQTVTSNTNEPFSLIEYLMFDDINPNGSDLYAQAAWNYSFGDMNKGAEYRPVFDAMKAYNYRRLYLKSVRIENAQGNSEDQYLFDYLSPELLPRRTSMRHNKYGFRRWHTNQKIGKFNTTNVYSADNGMDNESESEYGTLNKITYPAGGYTEFDYIRNRGNLLDYVSTYNASDKLISKKSYEYSVIKQISSLKTRTYQNVKPSDNSGFFKYCIATSYPQNKVELTKGNFRGIGEVLVKNINTQNGNSEGYVHHFFTYPHMTNKWGISFKPTNHRIFADQNEYYEDGSTHLYTDLNVFPYPMQSSIGFLTGLPYKKEVYSESGTLLERSTKEFELNSNGYNPPELKFFEGGKFDFIIPVLGDYLYGNHPSPTIKHRWTYPKWKSNWLTLKKSTTKTFKNGRSSELVQTFSYYTDMRLKTTETYNTATQDERIILDNYYGNNPIYPAYYIGLLTNTYTADDLVWNILSYYLSYKRNDPLSIVESRVQGGNRSVVGARLNLIDTYTVTDAPNSSAQLVSSIWNCSSSNDFLFKPFDIVVDQNNHLSFVKNDCFRSVVDNINYDNNGNLIYLERADGTSESYNYGYNNSLMTSSTVNPDGYAQTTTYDYKPLVGPTRITDPNGVVTTYQYDDYNRLRLIKDDNDNILERYTYNNLNEGNSLQGYLEYSGVKVINESLSFRLEGTSQNKGKSKYIWDFGDGTVSESFSNFRSHSFSEEGTYKVKVVIENPDYNQTREVIKNIYISENWATLNVCSDISRKNICSGEYTARTCGILLENQIEPPPGGDDIGPPVNLMATMSSGAVCSGSLTYSWKYRSNGGAWSAFGSNKASLTFPYSYTAGNYEVMCTVRDNCNNTFSDTTTFFISEAGCSWQH